MRLTGPPPQPPIWARNRQRRPARLVGESTGPRNDVRFEIEGRLDGLHVTLIWDRGTLTGPETAVGFITQMADLFRREPVAGFPGPHLKKAVNALALISYLMDEVDEVRGQIPSSRTAPEGALI